MKLSHFRGFGVLGVYGLHDNELDILYDIMPHTDVALWVVLLNVLLKLIKIQLVAIFKPAVVLAVLLNGVVRQMHHLILCVVKPVLEGGCPQIPLLEEVNLHILVYEDPDTDVKLALIYQKWPLYVFLDNERHVLCYVEGTLQKLSFDNLLLLLKVKDIGIGC